MSNIFDLKGDQEFGVYTDLSKALERTAKSHSSSEPLLKQTLEQIASATKIKGFNFTFRDFRDPGSNGVGFLDVVMHAAFYSANNHRNIAHATALGKALLRQGCPPHKISEHVTESTVDEFAPSQYAAKLGAVSLLADMLNYAKADPVLLDEKGNNLLHLVCANPDFVGSTSDEAVEVFTQLASDPIMRGHRNDEGLTPLQVMAGALRANDKLPDKMFQLMLTNGGTEGLDKKEFHNLCISLMNHPRRLVSMLDVKTPPLSNEETLETLSNLLRSRNENDLPFIEKWMTHIEHLHQKNSFADEELAHVVASVEPTYDVIYARLAKLMTNVSSKVLERAIRLDCPKTVFNTLERAKDINSSAIISSLVHTNQAQDLLAEFSRRVIMPAAMIEGGFDPENPEAGSGRLFDHLATQYYSAHSQHYEALLGTLLAQYGDLTQPDNIKKAYAAIANLSRTWHHPSIVFPNSLVDFQGREWKPILREEWVASNGYRLICLTTNHQLEETHEVLGHCINNYTANCCSPNEFSRSHILNILDPEGTLVATAELKIGKHDSIIHSNDVCLTQLEGKVEKGNRTLIRSGPVLDAVKELLNNKRNFLSLEDLGETNESASKLNNCKSIYDAGYIPTAEALQKAFDEFRQENRRGALSVSKTNTLIYNDAPGSTDATPQHLIDGLLEITQPDGSKTQKSAREVNVQEWLDATGIREMVRDDIRKYLPELAAQREAVWAGRLEQQAPPVPASSLAGTKVSHAAHGDVLMRLRQALWGRHANV